ncbi:hypothetical protein BDZ89DRAFT_1152982 [Hymenopellis radicata]|nr:hypothetical protein BDZ89DRAFT_1152982 [Hymenopellis radicata]
MLRARLCRSLSTEVHHPAPSTSLIPILHRDPSHPDVPLTPGARSISLALPKDQSPPSAHSLSDPTSNAPPPPQPPPPPTADEQAAVATTSGVPSTLPAPSKPPTYSHPPFHTHAFFTALEKTFPTPTARSLMRATRGLLVDRIGRVRREGLQVKDLDNQAYLFRAALSELRQDVTTNIKNDTASIVASTAAMRKEVDKLDVKMKEDVSTLKHEIQMEVDSRKNEVREEFKQQDIQLEEMLSKAIVEISELRTRVEEVKWHNMRRAVVTLFSFVALTIVGLELRPKPPTTSALSRTNTTAKPDTRHSSYNPRQPGRWSGEVGLGHIIPRHRPQILAYITS